MNLVFPKTQPLCSRHLWEQVFVAVGELAQLPALGIPSRSFTRPSSRNMRRSQLPNGSGYAMPGEWLKAWPKAWPIPSAGHMSSFWRN